MTTDYKKSIINIPIDIEIDSLEFNDIFIIEDLQRLQDLFSDTNNVASIITSPDGIPITSPSNFTRLCNNIIRKSQKGCINCIQSDSIIGRQCTSGPIVQKCLSGELMDAGVSITIGDKHIANWLIGQVRCDEIDENRMLQYADEIGVNRTDFMEALMEVPVMPLEKFNKIGQLLFAFVQEISEKVYINLLLKKQIEEREAATNVLTDVLENLPAIVFWKDIHSNYLGCNHAFAIGAGLENSVEIVGKTDYDLPWGETEAKYYITDDSEVIKSGKPKLHILEKQHQVNQNVTWLDTSKIPLLNSKAQIFGILGVSIDITKLKLAEELHKQISLRYETLFTKASDGIISILPDGKIIEANEAYSKIHGYSVDELLKMNIRDLDTSETADLIEERISRILAGETLQFESKHYHKDGHIIILEVSVSNVSIGEKTVILALNRDITERNKVLESLKHSEEKFRKAFLVNPDSININRFNDGVYVSVNHGFTQIMEYSEDDVIGKSSLELNIWNNPEDRNHLVKGLKTRGFVENLEAQFLSKSGKIIIGLMSAAIIELEGTMHIISITRDITERKKAEQELKLLSRAIKQSPVSIVITNKTGDIEYTNPKFSELTGYSFDEIKGENPRFLQSGYHTNEFYEELWETLMTGFDWHGEFHNKKKNGESYWESAIISSIFNNRGEISSFIAVKEDITERKKMMRDLVKAKERAEENEAKYKILFDTLTEGVALNEIVFDEQGVMIDYRIIEVNNAFYTTADIATDQVIGNLATNLYGMSTNEITFFWQQHRHLHKTAFTEMLSPISKRWYYVSTSPFVNNRFVTSFFDITNLKQSELLLKENNEELIKAKEKAEESDRLKTAFLQNLSHEIRTPMNAIMGFSELLIQQYNNKSNLEKYSKIINQRSNDLLHIINDLLDIAKIESGQLSVNMENCDLPKLFNGLNNFFTEYINRLGKQHISLSMETPGDVHGNIIVTDKGKLNQILTNLIENAFKYTENGEIHVGYRFDQNQYIQFYVSDTGMGIPQDKQNKIFERFAQLSPAANRTISGTGLGLSIVNGLVSLLGGKIFLKSELEKGSTFTFTIPYKPVNLAQFEPQINEKHLDG